MDVQNFFISLTLLFILLQRNSSHGYLPVCSNNFLSPPQTTQTLNNGVVRNADEKFSEDWFKWGRLYSYCMQNETTVTSKGCSTVSCTECMKACSSDNPFNSSSCLSNCSTDECRKGCNFYKVLHGPTPSRNTFDDGNVPQNSSQSVLITDISITNLSYSWHTILSKGTPKLSSIYLVVLNVYSNDDYPNIKNVLGLIAEPNITVTINGICSSFRFYGRYSKTMKYRIFIYPMNLNGVSTSIQSNYTVLKAPPDIKNIDIGNPMQVFLHPLTDPYLRYNINFTLPADEDLEILSLFKSVVIKRQVSRCTLLNRQNIPSIVGTLEKTIAVNHANAMNYSMFFDSLNTDMVQFSTDALRSCTLQFTIVTKFGECIAGPSLIKLVDYAGCETVPNMVCPPSPTEKPTDLPPTDIAISQSDTLMGRCNKTITTCHTEEGNVTCHKCVEMLYDVTVTWRKPSTSTPIQFYHVRWGFGRTVFGSIQNEEGSVNIKDDNITSYNISNIMVTGKNIDFGVQVQVKTSTPGVPFPRPNDAGTTTFIKFTGLPDPSFPAPGKSEESSDNWIAAAVIIPLFVVLIVIGSLWFFLKRRTKKQTNIEYSHDGLSMYMDPINGNVACDEWEIFPVNITLDEKIGEGAFGTVFSANIQAVAFSHSKYSKQRGVLLSEKNPKVAVKLLKESANEMEHNDFKEEIQLMKTIGYHKNIVNLIGCSTVKTPMYLIVEFMAGGDLLHFLRKRRSKLCATNSDGGMAGGFMYTQTFQDSLQTTTSENSKAELVVEPTSPTPSSLSTDDVITPDDLLSFAWQIASGMEYLAVNNLVHRDLAARNILVGIDKSVKISDFGLTRAVSSDLIYMSSKNRRLPVKWMSVEAIFDQMFTTFSDVWAYGVVLFEIVTLGGTPYPSINNRELLGLLKSGYRMEKPNNCADPMYDIMLHCWNEDPLQRPNFTELREHLEAIISQGDNYFSFDINEQNTYYNVASFKSVPSDTEDEIFDEDYLNKPMQVKTVDELKKLKQEVSTPSLKEEKLKGDDTSDGAPIDQRYIQMKASKDIDRPASTLEQHSGNTYVNSAFDRSNTVL